MIGIIVKIKLAEPWEYYDWPTLNGVVRDLKGESLLVELDNSILVQKRQIKHLVVRPRVNGDSIYQLLEGKEITSALEIIWVTDEKEESLFDVAERNRGFQGFIGSVKKSGRIKLFSKEIDILKKKHTGDDSKRNVAQLKKQANEAWLEKNYKKAFGLYKKIGNELTELEEKRYLYIKNRMKYIEG